MGHAPFLLSVAAPFGIAGNVGNTVAASYLSCLLPKKAVAGLT